MKFFKKPSIRVALILLAIAVVFEVSLGNLAFWTTGAYDPVTLSTETKVLEKVTDTLVIDAGDQPIDSLTISLDDSKSKQEGNVIYSIVDDGHTQKAYKLPAVRVTSLYEPSCTTTLHAYGNVKNITISFDAKTSFPVKVSGLEANHRIPFGFNFVRVLMIVGIGMAIYLFRPRSFLFTRRAESHPKTFRRGMCLITGVVCALLVIHCAGYIMLAYQDAEERAQDALVHPEDYVNDIKTDDASNGSWSNSTARAQYDFLAEALLKGQCYLDIQPPQWLDDLDNPYDKSVRSAMEKQYPDETALWDYAYYEGKYYVYFGVVPCLLFFVPTHALFHTDLIYSIPTDMCLIAFVLGLSFLLSYIARTRFPHASIAVMLLCFAASLVCSGMVYPILTPSLYQLPPTLSVALIVWGLFLWLKGWDKRSIVMIAGGSLCIALIFGCRPTMGLVAVFAVPLLWKTMRSSDMSIGRKVAVFVAVILPFVVVAVGLMYYNVVRFGSPFDFGANYNLTTNDMTLRGFVLERFINAAYCYFIQPPNISTVFPFMHSADLGATYQGETIHETSPGGVFAVYPFLLIVVFLGIMIKRCRSKATCSTAGIWAAFSIVLLVLGILIGLLDGQAAGLLARYQLDFTLFLALAASIVALYLSHEKVFDSGDVEKPATSTIRAAFVAVVFISFVSFSLLALMILTNAGGDTGSQYLEQTDSLYCMVRDTLQFWM